MYKYIYNYISVVLSTLISSYQNHDYLTHTSSSHCSVLMRSYEENKHGNINLCKYVFNLNG